MVKKQRVGVIGLGLIGGSIALALKDEYEVCGYDVDARTREYAAEHVCKPCEISEMRDCVAVFVCVPLWCMSESLKTVSELLPNVLLTDVGSVKTPFAGICKRYVGGHPMAGVERGGIRSAKRNLFKDAYWAITDGGADGATVEGIVSHTGATVVRMTAKEHDIAVARYSHVPHAAAYALVNASSDTAPIAGSGFLDTTRIAQSDEKFWTEVFALNGDNVARELDALICELENIKGMVKRREYPALSEYLRGARQKREALNRVDMGGEALYVDLIDRVGEFERVTGIISKAKINMINIALVPSREGALGALRLEFSTQADKAAAERVLKERGYAAK